MIRPSLFRKGAFALTTAGVLAASSLLSLSAAAETTKPAAASNGGVTATTDCSTYRPDMAFGETMCEALRGKALKAEGKALDKDISAEARLKMCIVQLTKFKQEKPSDFAKFGIITRENACALAARLPQKNAALN